MERPIYPENPSEEMEKMHTIFYNTQEKYRSTEFDGFLEECFQKLYDQNECGEYYADEIENKLNHMIERRMRDKAEMMFYPKTSSMFAVRLPENCNTIELAAARIIEIANMEKMTVRSSFQGKDIHAFPQESTIESIKEIFLSGKSTAEFYQEKLFDSIKQSFEKAS